MFAWNPSPRGPSRITFEYLLLPPRSALAAVPHILADMLLYNRHVPSTHLRLSYTNGVVSAARFSAIHFQG